jgi:uncharacterized membrane protein
MSSLRRSTDRINNFSDGVFGVAATVMIVQVIESGMGEVGDERPTAGQLLLEILPAVAVWFLSVGVVGTFWIAHHNILHLVKKWDRWLLWINTGFLMSVTFLLLPMAILARYWDETRLGVTAYGASLIVSSLWLCAIWEYIWRHRELLWEDVNPELFKPVRRQILTGPAVYCVAIVLGWLSHWLPSWLSIWPALLLFGGVQIWYMLPGNIDRDAKRRSSAPLATSGE